LDEITSRKAFFSDLDRRLECNLKRRKINIKNGWNCNWWKTLIRKKKMLNTKNEKNLIKYNQNSFMIFQIWLESIIISTEYWIDNVYEYIKTENKSYSNWRCSKLGGSRSFFLCFWIWHQRKRFFVLQKQQESENWIKCLVSVWRRFYDHIHEQLKLKKWLNLFEVRIHLHLRDIIKEIIIIHLLKK
jgi:hypothetical protein